MARTFSAGDRVKVSSKARKKYGSMTMTPGVLVGQARHHHYGIHWRVLHDDGWENEWRISDLEHIGILEDVAATLTPDEP